MVDLSLENKNIDAVYKCFWCCPLIILKVQLN